jgi:hypothetical protein
VDHAARVATVAASATESAPPRRLRRPRLRQTGRRGASL